MTFRFKGVQLHGSLNVRDRLIIIAKSYKVQAIQNMGPRIIGIQLQRTLVFAGGGPVPLVIVNARQQGMIAFHAQPPDLPPVPLIGCGLRDPLLARPAP